MSNWLEQLERELDERLAAFLSQNPVQEQLFRQQHQLDRAPVSYTHLTLPTIYSV